MRILLISALPEIHRLFGLRHHYPVGGLFPVDGTSPAGGTSASSSSSSATTPGSGEEDAVTFTEIAHEDAGAPARLLTATPGQGRLVAHLTGTSPSMLRWSEELGAAGIPFVYSPMIPSHPSGAARLARFLTGRPGDELRDFGIASRIAAAAVKVVADSTIAEEAYRRLARIPGVKMQTVAGPEMTIDRRSDGSPTPTHSVGAGNDYANLAVAYCDEIAPEWNVMHFLFAMEKINADALVVAAKTDTPYSRECADRAALNGRIKFVAWERGDAITLTRELAVATSRASIVVDPSLRGLGGAIVRGFSTLGVASVLSLASVRGMSPAGGIFTFEPSSWELMNHAITCAFNRAAAGAQRQPGAADSANRNAENARALMRIYAQAAGA